MIAVGWNLAEAERAVERHGFRHSIGNAVEAHLAITQAPGFSDNRGGEGSADSQTDKGRADIEALHFALVIIETPQSDASDGLAFPPGEQQAAIGRAVQAGQARELALDIAGAQVNCEPLRILAEQIRHLRKGFLHACYYDFSHG